MRLSKENYLTACGILELTIMEGDRYTIFKGIFNNYYEYSISLRCDIKVDTHSYKTGKIRKRDIIDRMVEWYRRDDRPYGWVYKLNDNTVNGVKKIFHYYSNLK